MVTADPSLVFIESNTQSKVHVPWWIKLGNVAVAIIAFLAILFFMEILRFPKANISYVLIALLVGCELGQLNAASLWIVSGYTPRQVFAILGFICILGLVTGLAAIQFLAMSLRVGIVYLGIFMGVVFLCYLGIMTFTTMMVSRFFGTQLVHVELDAWKRGEPNLANWFEQQSALMGSTQKKIREWGLLILVATLLVLGLMFATQANISLNGDPFSILRLTGIICCFLFVIGWTANYAALNPGWGVGWIAWAIAVLIMGTAMEAMTIQSALGTSNNSFFFYFYLVNTAFFLNGITNGIIARLSGYRLHAITKVPSVHNMVENQRG